jgi:hypothetical protein
LTQITRVGNDFLLISKCGKYVRRAFSAAIGSKTPGGAGTHERYYVVKDEFDASKVRKKLKQLKI